MHESGVAPNTAATWVFISRQLPWYTYGGNTIRPSHPASAAAFARDTASEVVSAEMEATTGPRPRIALTHARSTPSFSSNDKVAPSPSDPRATIPLQPFSSSQR